MKGDIFQVFGLRMNDYLHPVHSYNNWPIFPTGQEAFYWGYRVRSLKFVVNLISDTGDKSYDVNVPMGRTQKELGLPPEEHHARSEADIFRNDPPFDSPARWQWFYGDNTGETMNLFVWYQLTLLHIGLDLNVEWSANMSFTDIGDFGQVALEPPPPGSVPEYVESNAVLRLNGDDLALSSVLGEPISYSHEQPLYQIKDTPEIGGVVSIIPIRFFTYTDTNPDSPTFGQQTYDEGSGAFI